MKRFARDFLTGATALVGLIGTAGMLLVFGELDILTTRKYWFELQLDTARGLSPGARVTLNGVEVGRVRSTDIAPHPEDGVVVRVVIDGDRKVPRDFEVFLDRSLAGEATLDLGTRSIPPGTPAAFIEPGETLVRSAITLVDEIGNRLAAPIDIVERAAQTFDELTAAFVKVSDGIDRVLMARTPEEVDAGAEATLPSTIARLDRALANANLWLDDPALRDDASRGIREAVKVIESLEGAVAQWKSAAATLEGEATRAGDAVTASAAEVAKAGERITAALAAIEGAANEVQKLTGQLGTGEGSAALFVRDPTLYRSLLDATRRLDRTLEEAGLLLEAYRKEGLPIRF